jgi:hypothetical protein
MSEFGPNHTFRCRGSMSALRGKADIEIKSVTSAFDPKRTLNAPNGPAVEAGFSHYQNAPLSRYDAASGA